jgi:hypothetical protein
MLGDSAEAPLTVLDAELSDLRWSHYPQILGHA